MVESSPNVPSSDLAAAMHRKLMQFDLSREHSAWLVDTLIETSLRGIDTHGVELFPVYLQELAGGRAKTQPQFATTASTPCLALIDVGGALGVVGANYGMRQAISLAKDSGVGLVVVRNSNHFGAAGYYSDLAARAGLIGITSSNADALVAAHGGNAPVAGTNPIAVSAPAMQGKLFSLDMATSQVAYSRVRQFLEAGKALAAGWAVDANGSDSALSGQYAALQPLGGYKGQGLGMAVQILCGLLGSGPLDHELTHLYGAPYTEPRQIGHFFLCISIDRFAPLEEFTARMTALAHQYRQNGSSADVLVPGDKEQAAFEIRTHSGIPVSRMLSDALRVGGLT